MNRSKLSTLALGSLVLLSAFLVLLAVPQEVEASHCWVQEQYAGCCSCNNTNFKVRTCCSNGWCSGWTYQCDYGNCCGSGPCCF